jgi:hypothetical protein
MDDLVRLLLISALAGTLAGCSSAPQQMNADRGLYQTNHEPSSQAHSKRRVFTAKKVNARHRTNNNSTRIAESHNALKMNAASFVRPNDKSNIVTTTPTVATKTEIPHDEAAKPEIPPTKTEIPHDEAAKPDIPPSSQLDDASVIKKAKATIAAGMKDPNSVEFEGMERAARKNALGKSIDTICGFVRDKNSGPKPFLYLVQKDEAYIGGYTIATSEYRNICSITALPEALPATQMPRDKSEKGESVRD